MMRSSVSGRVVNLSRGNPVNAESVVFSTTRFARPATIAAPLASRVTTAVQCSAPACTNAWGCGSPPADNRLQGCSDTLMRARATPALGDEWAGSGRGNRLAGSVGGRPGIGEALVFHGVGRG